MPMPPVRTHLVEVNGYVGIAIEIGGQLDALMMLETHAGVIGNVFILRNPDKLARLVSFPSQ